MKIYFEDKVLDYDGFGITKDLTELIKKTKKNKYFFELTVKNNEKEEIYNLFGYDFLDLRTKFSEYTGKKHPWVNEATFTKFDKNNPILKIFHWDNLNVFEKEKNLNNYFVNLYLFSFFYHLFYKLNSKKINNYLSYMQKQQTFEDFLKKNIKDIEINSINNKCFFITFKVDQFSNEIIKNLNILQYFDKIIYKKIFDDYLISKQKNKNNFYCAYDLKLILKYKNNLNLIDVSDYILPTWEILSNDFIEIKENKVNENSEYSFSINFKKSIEKKKYSVDHRDFLKKYEIAYQDPLIGIGFWIWLKNGLFIKNKVKSYIKKLEAKQNYFQIKTPVAGTLKLYKKSEHLKYYKKYMFPQIKYKDKYNKKENHNEDYDLMLKPMSCPHHCIYFNSKKRYFSELPLRFADHTELFRNEETSSVMGFLRTKNMELTDSHIFCPNDEKILINEIKSIYKFIKEVLDYTGIEIKSVSLSINDENKPEKFSKDKRIWDQGNKVLEKALNELNILYIIEEGEAAFYGPKIDIQIINGNGQEMTISTIQLDYLLANRFNLSYFDKNDKKQTPVIIHRSIIGTYERFLAAFLETHQDNIPFKFHFNQFGIVAKYEKNNKSFNDKLYGLCNDLKNILIDNDFSCFFNEKQIEFKKQLKKCYQKHIFYQIIIGESELNLYNESENNLTNIKLKLKNIKTNKIIETSLKEFFNNKNLYNT